VVSGARDLRWVVQQGHRLLRLHPLLKCLTKAKEFPALDEEMSRSSHSIFVDVGVPCAPSIEHLLR
jgi:hypothetical protein